MQVRVCVVLALTYILSFLVYVCIIRPLIPVVNNPTKNKLFLTYPELYAIIHSCSNY
jgi:peptidoglycan/LPS O-acetylase OafA/YrhL